MDDQTLFDKIANSKDPLKAIDELKEYITPSFVERLNATALETAQSGDFGPALMGNSWALKAVEYTGDKVLKAHTLFNRGQYASGAGNYDEAEKSYRQAFTVYEKEKNAVDILDCAAGLLQVLESKGNTGEIQMISRKAMSLALEKSGELSAEVGRGLMNIGRVLRRQGESTIARECFEILLQLGDQLEDSEYKAEAYGQLAELFADEENLEEAKELYIRTIELDEKNANFKLKAIDLGNLGFICFRLGNLEEARDAYNQCLKLREREGFFDRIDIDLKHAYHVSHYLGQRDEALELYKKYNVSDPMQLSMPVPIEETHYPLELDDYGRKLSQIKYDR
jgi:tetratricopeptide (TPR) repeat protein